MTVLIHLGGNVVSRSRNLRGVMRYGKRPRSPVRGASIECVHVLELPDGALLRVRWTDGAYCVARFASCTTARRWAQARLEWPCARYTPLHHWHAPTRGDA